MPPHPHSPLASSVDSLTRVVSSLASPANSITSTASSLTSTVDPPTNATLQLWVSRNAAYFASGDTEAVEEVTQLGGESQMRAPLPLLAFPIRPYVSNLDFGVSSTSCKPELCKLGLYNLSTGFAGCCGSCYQPCSPKIW